MIQGVERGAWFGIFPWLWPVHHTPSQPWSQSLKGPQGSLSPLSQDRNVIKVTEQDAGGRGKWEKRSLRGFSHSLFCSGQPLWDPSPHPAHGNLQPSPDPVASPSRPQTLSIHPANLQLPAVCTWCFGHWDEAVPGMQRPPHIRPLAPAQPRIPTCPHSWLPQTPILPNVW